MPTNKLGITDSLELKLAEEKITKLKAKQLFDSNYINNIEVGSYKGLATIHKYLFEDIYYFAGKLRDVNIAKDNFQFAPRMFLESSLDHIDKLPNNTFDEIIDKYAEMNVAHPFREGNGRAMRIWLDVMLKKHIQKVVDWSKVDKNDYLLAIRRSPVKTIELKYIISNALTDKIDDRNLYMQGIDYSYYYEGYTEFKTEEINE